MLVTVRLPVKAPLEVGMWNLVLCLRCGATFSVEYEDCPYCNSGQLIEVEQFHYDGQVAQPHSSCPHRRGTAAWRAWMRKELLEVAE